MSVLGIHHVGLAVANIGTACDALGRRRFAGDPWFEVDGPDGARGNGLDELAMRVAFVSDGPRTIEVIEPIGPAAGHVPERGDAGHQRWEILSDAGMPDADADAALPGVAWGTVGDQPSVELTAIDPSASLELLGALGLAPTTEPFTVACGDIFLRVIAATTDRPAPAPNQVGRSHVAFQVGHAASTHQRLREQGFDCVSEPIAHGDSIQWFFVRDPGGSGQFEVIEDRS